MATLPSSGQLSINAINAEFGYGNDLNSYRGKTWYTDAGGSGTFSSGAISMGDFYGKRATSAAWTGTISTNQQQMNLRSWAVANGWNGTQAATITVASNVYIWSDSTSVAAMTIDGSWPGGVTLVNNGFIMGRGGNGAGYVNGGASSTSPTSGGPAISLGVSATITNNSYIGGGGGGGGGTGYTGGGAGGGWGGQNSTANSSAYGKGGAIGASGTAGVSFASGNPATVFNQWMTGAGGGRIFPGVGGAGASFSTNTLAAGGGAGGGGGARLVTNYGTASLAQVGGNGGSGGAAGGNGSQPTGAVTSTVAPSGGGGGWGASGGYYSPGSLAAGTGGKAIALNGYTATRNGSGTTYGAVA